MSEQMSEAPTERPDHQRWNYNIHYQRPLVADLPTAARTALDVGCGEGYLARRLAERGLEVTAIDSDPAAIARARAQGHTVDLLDSEDSEHPSPSPSITYRVGDVMTEELGTYDVVTAVTTLHHLDLEAGLERLAALVAPGGRLVIVGIAASNWPQDLPRDVWATFVDKFQRLFRGYWDHGCECVWPAPHSFRDVSEAAERLLPGSVYTRELLWRYTLTWDRPAG
ncbi:class I SAM-dependent methyltransferase [Demequina sp. SYSU T00039]|uniref:Class I SAM-dependent methyltransferase n=1 Tax=Demequina lignilytica TaxID=3051663 RepID=A0AAW7M914_9MICO|nr:MULTISPECIES: class I SAM-dependent methyltransferase [unclassified Demequina]MDN4477718.1 class I SAM-dependent methyltransferase [Demequina sp. SYSU T00039-1]MDN4487627.1 class I SAM-dependent methyltransferase [Demequina sp. SYSU T00039]MDN4491338.1 class I SAM-dependent methyltransferase [Demequina sp. SYSU T00068]